MLFIFLKTLAVLLDAIVTVLIPFCFSWRKRRRIVASYKIWKCYRENSRPIVRKYRTFSAGGEVILSHAECMWDRSVEWRLGFSCPLKGGYELVSILQNVGIWPCWEQQRNHTNDVSAVLLWSSGTVFWNTCTHPSSPKDSFGVA